MKLSGISSDSKAMVLEYIRTPIAFLGISLIICGVLSFGYVGLAVVEILNDPGNSSMVQWLRMNLSADEIVLTISSDGKDIVIKASEMLQFIFYSLIIVFILSSFISVVSRLLSGGLKLVRLSYLDIPQSAPKRSRFKD